MDHKDPIAMPTMLETNSRTNLVSAPEPAKAPQISTPLQKLKPKPGPGVGRVCQGPEEAPRMVGPKGQPRKAKPGPGVGRGDAQAPRRP